MGKKDKKKEKKRGKKADRKATAESTDGRAKRHPLCKWDDLAYEDTERLANVVLGATHVCRKCGRAANDKRWLCKPVPLD